MFKWLKRFKRKKKNEYPYFAGTNEYEIEDFIDAPFGLLVVHSDHFYKERGQKRPETPQYGIVEDNSFFQDGKGRVIAHPNVLWEGSSHSSMCHPMNVSTARPEQKRPIKKMDDGQWGTWGPNGPPPPKRTLRRLLQELYKGYRTWRDIV